MSTHPHRRIAITSGLMLGALLLTACQYLPNVALRLNTDGTVDFGSCEQMDDVASVKAEAYVRTGDEGAGSELSAENAPQSLEAGDVIHFSAPSREMEWDRISVSTQERGDLEGRVWGIFDRSHLIVGDWLWAKNSGPFERVEHCELDG